MKLVELINDLDSIDDDLIIFIENIKDSNSDIILAYTVDYDQGVKVENGRSYFYLLEIFLAKEFIEDWRASLGYSPKNTEIAKRLYEYGINDA